MTGLDFPYFPLWEDGLVPPVDPSDLKSAWKRREELRALYGSEPTVVSLDLRGNSGPEADFTAVSYRASMLGLLAERVGLLPPVLDTSSVIAVTCARPSLRRRNFALAPEYFGKC